MSYKKLPVRAAGVTLIALALLMSYKFPARSQRKDAVVTKKSTKYNILLIVSEDNAPDLGCYGSKIVKTPVLDSLAASGMRFDNAYVTYSVCSPSRASIFTGLYPHQNGQIGLATHKYRMYDGIMTMPEYLKKAGYRTGCIGKIHVNPESALPFDFRPPKGSPLLAGNFGRKRLPKYISLADSFFREGNDPFFLMVNFPDAHSPWKRQVDGMPENPLDGNDVKSAPAFMHINSGRLRSLTADYYNSIERMDEMAGDIIAKLVASGKADNTVIVYLADHGPEFSRGKFSNYEAGLKVPMIISWPGHIDHGEVCKRLVSSIDLLPTFLKIAGLNIPQALPGMPLQALVQNKTVANWRTYIYAESEGSFPHAYYPGNSIRDDRFKLIHNLLYEKENPIVKLYTEHNLAGFDGGADTAEIANSDAQTQLLYASWKKPPEYELYDLKNDPYEFNNLYTDNTYKTIGDELRNALEKWQQETIDPLADKKILQRFTDEVDAVVTSHPKMDDAKDTTFTWNYPKYFSAYIKSKVPVK